MLQKKAKEEALRKKVQEFIEQGLDQKAEVEIANSRNNAMLHVFWFMILLNRRYHFGKKMLGNLLQDMNDDADHFKMLLEGGVAWTWIFKELDRMGLKCVSDKERKHLERVGQGLYEKGVKHGGEEVINFVVENEKHYLGGNK